MENKLKASKVELEETLGQLNEAQLSRFRVLFARQQNKPWLIPIVYSVLGAYTLLATILLHPGYSWLVAMIPTLFVVFFVRSMLSGLVGEKKKERQTNYGSIILPIVMVSLFAVCGGLTYGYLDSGRLHQEYLDSYQTCQQDPEATVITPRYGYYSSRDCEYLIEAGNHEREVKQHERNQQQLVRGIAVTGLGLMIIYPLSVYYFKSLIDKKNVLAAQAIVAQIKSGDKNN